MPGNDVELLNKEEQCGIYAYPSSSGLGEEEAERSRANG